MSLSDRPDKGLERLDPGDASAGPGGTPGKRTRTMDLPVQRRATRAAAPATDPHDIADHGVGGAGGEFPHLALIQASFGRHDLSTVSAHTGGEARAASEQLGAEAYATGDRVAFRTTPDLHTAAHEAAHVVQQRGGVQLKSELGEAGDRYERHADAVADLVVQGRSAESLLDEHAGTGARPASRAPVQRLLAVGGDPVAADAVREQVNAHWHELETRAGNNVREHAIRVLEGWARDATEDRPPFPGWPAAAEAALASIREDVKAKRDSHEEEVKHREGIPLRALKIVRLLQSVARFGLLRADDAHALGVKRSRANDATESKTVDTNGINPDLAEERRDEQEDPYALGQRARGSLSVLAEREDEKQQSVLFERFMPLLDETERAEFEDLASKFNRALALRATVTRSVRGKRLIRDRAIESVMAVMDVESLRGQMPDEATYPGRDGDDVGELDAEAGYLRDLPARTPNHEAKWTSSIQPGGIKRMLVPAPFEKDVRSIIAEEGIDLPFALVFVPLTTGEVKVHFHDIEAKVRAPDYESELIKEKQPFFTHAMRIV